MPQHRALIVDDSRSARVVLTRMLESFGLAVDAVESAELALTHLQSSHPDVIFMDHLMPGMDGFDAVRVLKANPATAAIPVVMYTSQEGALYLSQARALGAIGVLPKTLKSGDVAQVLQQLNLVTAAGSKPSTTGAHPAAKPSTPAMPTSTESPVVVAPPAFASSHTGQLAHRIAAELVTELPALQVDALSAVRFWRGLTAMFAVLLLCALAGNFYLLQQTRQQLQTLQALPAPTNAVQAVTEMQSSSVTTAATVSKDASSSTNAVVLSKVSEPFAYGEVPLSGVRLERLRSLTNELATRAATASRAPPLLLRVQTYMGDFCLVTNANGGYELAPDDTPVTACETIGNPAGDNQSVQQRQSVAFANLVASINRKGNINVQLVDGGHAALVNYPARNDVTLAGAWNGIAMQNQRVEFITTEP